MRFLIRLVVIVIVMIAILIGGILMLPGEKIAGIAADQISKQTGRDVKISSDSSISLYPILGITTGAAEIGSTDWATGGPLLQTDSLAIGIDVMALIGGTIKITQMEAKSPRIVLETAADGRTNWELTPSAPASEPAADPVAPASDPTAGYGFSLERALITNASLRYIDAAAGTDQSFDSVDLEIRWPDLGGAADIVIGAAPFGERLDLTATVGNVMTLVGGDATPLTGTLSGATAKLSFEGSASIAPTAAMQISADIGNAGTLIKALGMAPADIGLAPDLSAPIKLDTQVTFLDNRIALRKMNAVIDGASISGDTDITLADTGPQIAANLSANIPNAAKLMAMVGQKPSDFGFSNSFAPSAKANLTASMNGDAIKLVLRDISAGQDGATVTGSADIAINNGAPNVSAQIKANVPSTAKLMALMGQGGVDIPKGFGQAITADTAVSFANDRLALRNLAVALDQNRITGSVDLNLAGSVPFIAANLNAGALDFSALAPDDTADSTSAGLGWSKDAIDASALGLVNGDISIKATSVDLGTLKLDATNIGITIDNSRAVFALQDVRAYSGVFKGQFVANNRNGLSVGGKINASSVQMKPLLTALADIDKFSGSGTFGVSFLGVGNTIDAIMRSLSGDTNLSIGRGEVTGIDLKGLILNGDASAATTVFDNMSATGTINKGVLSNNDLKLGINQVEVKGEGFIDLGGQRIDYLLTPKALKARDGKGFAIPVRIKGPWSSPEIRPDLEAALNLENERKKLEEQLKQEVENAKAKARKEAEAAIAKELGLKQLENERLEEAARRRIEEEKRKTEDALRDKLDKSLQNGLKNLLKN